MRKIKTVTFLTFMLLLSFKSAINTVQAECVAITILSDGNIEPSTSAICRDGNRYSFTKDIHGFILVEKDNITIDGDGFTLKPASACPVANRNGVCLNGREKVTIKSLKVDTAWYGFLIRNCSNITISEVTVTRSLHGILLSNSRNNTITASIVDENYHNGIQLCGSTSNTVEGNVVTDNGEAGVILEQSSYNDILRNLFQRNLDGIVLIESNQNQIMENNVTANVETVVWIYCSHENLVFHNNFIDNPVQTYHSVNAWDNGVEGNYWSNHNAPDNNGDMIGDFSYVIDENNTDRYPLIYPYGFVPKSDINEDGLVNILDISTVANAYGCKPGDSNWNPMADMDTNETINILDISTIAMEFGKTV